MTMETDEQFKIKTIETHPDHHTVGRLFGGHSMQTEQSEVYICDSYDPRMGYWLTSVSISGKVERKNVSERAIGRTYWPADTFDQHWFITQWGKRVEKPSRVLGADYTLRVAKLDENCMLILGRSTNLTELKERAREYMQEHCSGVDVRRCELEDSAGGRVLSDVTGTIWHHSPYAHWPDQTL